MREGSVRRHKVLDAVADAAVILAPSHLTSVGAKIGAADAVVDAHLSAAKAREKRLRLIGAGVAFGIALAVIDALREETVVQAIPAGGFIGIDGRAGNDALGDGGDRCLFRAGHGGDRAAVALTNNDDDPALARLVHRLAAINAVGFLVGRADVAAEVSAIDLDLTGSLMLGDLSADRLAQLVRENERRLVLAVEVAGELQGRVALGAVHEDRHGHEDVPQGHLAGGEDGARRDGELMLAGLALPELAGRQEAMGDTLATRAHWSAIRSGPAHHAEGVESLVVRHAGDLR